MKIHKVRMLKKNRRIRYNNLIIKFLSDDKGVAVWVQGVPCIPFGGGENVPIESIIIKTTMGECFKFSFNEETNGNRTERT